MPTVIVEDGTLVANANSFVTSVDVSNYCTARGRVFTGTQQELDAAVLFGGDYLRNEQRFRYRGALRTATQTMPYPRDGASFVRGPEIPNTVIPQCLKFAQCELAYRARTGDLQPDLDYGGRVKSEKVGPIETEYFQDAPNEVVITAVLGILWPILLNGGEIYPEPFLAEPVTHTPFRPGEYDNPPQTYVTDPTASS